MPRNYFTDEQIKILEENPYVLKVSKANVVFTEDFKREFMRLYESGLGPSGILRRLGIDPQTLGKTRITKLSERLRKQSSRPEGFSRKPNSSKGRPRKGRQGRRDIRNSVMTAKKRNTIKSTPRSWNRRSNC